LRLPALIRDLEISYTALSLVAPEKNQFRYQLQGHDRDWQTSAIAVKPSTTIYRRATTLPRHRQQQQRRVERAGRGARFLHCARLLADDLVPCGVRGCFLLVLWALYQLRLRQIRQAFNARLEERVGERTRIARDLHDTLLQNFQGLLLRFQTVLSAMRDTPGRRQGGPSELD